MVQVVAFPLQVMVLVEEGWGKHAGEWALKAERLLKQRTEGRKTIEEMDRKKETNLKLLRF